MMWGVLFKPLGASCPHILHYHRAWQENGHFYIQYEYCARGDLQGLSVKVHYCKRIMEFSMATVGMPKSLQSPE